jgi:Fe-S cluster assembly protein SufD
LAKNSEVNVITVSKSLSDGISFCNSQNEIFLEANSTLNFNIFQEENIETRSLNNTRLKQSENTQSTVNIASLSGAILRNDIKIYLSGENARTEINGIYLPTNEQQFDNYILIEHEKSHGKSRQLFKGIIDGQARSVFSGRVLVDKNAQKTDAGQLNKNLLLTDYAKAYSRPQLEIYADDVQCSHGSSTGQIDKESLFYLQSRGIGEKQAKILMLNAFAKEVIDKISIPEYKNYIENKYF